VTLLALVVCLGRLGADYPACRQRPGAAAPRLCGIVAPAPAAGRRHGPRPGATTEPSG